MILAKIHLLFNKGDGYETRFFIIAFIISSFSYEEAYRINSLDRGLIGIRCGAGHYMGEKGGLFINFAQNGLILLRRDQAPIPQTSNQFHKVDEAQIITGSLAHAEQIAADCEAYLRHRYHVMEQAIKQNQNGIRKLDVAAYFVETIHEWVPSPQSMQFFEIGSNVIGGEGSYVLNSVDSVIYESLKDNPEMCRYVHKLWRGIRKQIFIAMKDYFKPIEAA